MAKTSGKKPSAQAKSVRKSGPVRGNQKKSSGASSKAAARSVARPASRPAPAGRPGQKARASSKPVAALRPAEKQKGDGKRADGKPGDRKLGAISAKAPLATARNGAKPSAEAVAPLAPVAVQPLPANGKPRKNQAGFSTRDLEHFRDLLLAKRRELIGDMSSMEREALRVGGGSNLSNLPIHMADMGTDNYEQEFTLGLVQKERDLLKEINLALAKIQNGVYGLCEGTGQPILKERLEYQPWARYSVEYQRKMERHGR